MLRDDSEATFHRL